MKRERTILKGHWKRYAPPFYLTLPLVSPFLPPLPQHTINREWSSFTLMIVSIFYVGVNQPPPLL